MPTQPFWAYESRDRAREREAQEQTEPDGTPQQSPSGRVPELPTLPTTTTPTTGGGTLSGLPSLPSLLNPASVPANTTQAVVPAATTGAAQTPTAGGGLPNWITNTLGSMFGGQAGAGLVAPTQPAALGYGAVGSDPAGLAASGGMPSAGLTGALPAVAATRDWLQTTARPIVDWTQNEIAAPTGGMLWGAATGDATAQRDLAAAALMGTGATSAGVNNIARNWATQMAGGNQQTPREYYRGIQAETPLAWQMFSSMAFDPINYLPLAGSSIAGAAGGSRALRAVATTMKGIDTAQNVGIWATATNEEIPFLVAMYGGGHVAMRGLSAAVGKVVQGRRFRALDEVLTEANQYELAAQAVDAFVERNLKGTPAATTRVAMESEIAQRMSPAQRNLWTAPDDSNSVDMPTAWWLKYQLMSDIRLRQEIDPDFNLWTDVIKPAVTGGQVRDPLSPQVQTTLNTGRVWESDAWRRFWQDETGAVGGEGSGDDLLRAQEVRPPDTQPQQGGLFAPGEVPIEMGGSRAPATGQAVGGDFMSRPQFESDAARTQWEQQQAEAGGQSRMPETQARQNETITRGVMEPYSPEELARILANPSGSRFNRGDTDAVINAARKQSVLADSDRYVFATYNGLQITTDRTQISTTQSYHIAHPDGSVDHAEPNFGDVPATAPTTAPILGTEVERPTVAGAGPQIEGQYQAPSEVWSRLNLALREEDNQLGAASRARKPENKAIYSRSAAQKRQHANTLAAEWLRWSAENPEEAAQARYGKDLFAAARRGEGDAVDQLRTQLQGQTARSTALAQPAVAPTGAAPSAAQVTNAPSSPAVAHTITERSAKGGVEVSFPSKPDDATLATMHQLGFRWGREDRVWYKTPSSEPDRTSLVAQVREALGAEPAAQVPTAEAAAGETVPARPAETPTAAQAEPATAAKLNAEQQSAYGEALSRMRIVLEPQMPSADGLIMEPKIFRRVVRDVTAEAAKLPLGSAQRAEIEQRLSSSVKDYDDWYTERNGRSVFDLSGPQPTQRKPSRKKTIAQAEPAAPPSPERAQADERALLQAEMDAAEAAELGRNPLDEIEQSIVREATDALDELERVTSGDSDVKGILIQLDKAVRAVEALPSRAGIKDAALQRLASISGAQLAPTYVAANGTQIPRPTARTEESYFASMFSEAERLVGKYADVPNWRHLLKANSALLTARYMVLPPSRGGSGELPIGSEIYAKLSRRLDDLTARRDALREKYDPTYEQTAPASGIMEAGGEANGPATETRVGSAVTEDRGRADSGALAPVQPEAVSGAGSAGEPGAGSRAPGAGDGEGGVSISGGGHVPAGSRVRGDEGSGPGNPQVTRRAISSSSALAGGRDYQLTAEDAVGQGGPKAKYRANAEAIRLLHQLQAEDRLATPEEQAILVKYTGWGDSAFSPVWGEGEYAIYESPTAYYRDSGLVRAEKAGWEKEYREIRDLLTEEEFRAAARSTLNAHYTSPEVITAMWKALERLGAGQVGRLRTLEPAAGVGHFLGLQPAEMVANGARTAVELDRLTGGILRQLYQNANVHITGFEQAPLPKSYYDVVISNVPFGKYQMTVPDWSATPAKRWLNQLSIHNQYFARALELARPGGVVAFITSHYTLDHTGLNRFREYLAGQADMLGAIRLPNSAFAKNAGTKVVTDVIFLRKRADGDTPLPADWIKTEEIKLSGTPAAKHYFINSYFVQHPEMVLGTHAAPEHSGMRGGYEYTVENPEGDLAAMMEEAIGRLPENAMRNAQEEMEASIRPPEPKAGRGSWVLKDGQVYVRGAVDELTPFVPKNGTEVGRVTGMVTVRDAAKALNRIQTEGWTEETLEPAMRALNEAYDRFVREYGPLTAITNRSLMSRFYDPDAGFVRALEICPPSIYKALADSVRDRKGKIRWEQLTAEQIAPLKTDIFRKPTARAAAGVTVADTPEDALAVSLNERGRVDLDFMATLLVQEPSEVRTALGGKVFEDPSTRQVIEASEYLSGNVREKLEVARAAAEADSAYQANVTALEAVQPKALLPSQISAHLGATWIPEEIVGRFAAELMGFADLGPQDWAKLVTYDPASGEWAVSHALNYGGSRQLKLSKWGVEGFPAPDILDAILNHKEIVVYGIDRVVLPQATANARIKASEMEAEFSRWAWSAPERADALQRIYNERFNSYVIWRPNGDYLTLPGANPEIKLRPHQRSAIPRALRQNTMLAHEVGAGKTFAMIATAMEARRLGVARRIMVVVPNHLVEQWARDWLRLYPGARVIVPMAKDFQKGNRQSFIGAMVASDYDALIVAQSQYTRLPPSIDSYRAAAYEMISEMDEAIAAARQNADPDDKAMRKTIKKLEEDRAKREALIERRMQQLQSRQDQGLNYSDLGIDMLMVDEADMFKNLAPLTRMGRIKGVSTSFSQRAFDMFVKTRETNRRNGGGRGIVFATGTPISNSVTELWTMLNYLAPDMLKSLGIGHFDEWAATFGKIESTLEQNMQGKFRSVQRFYRFSNAPELSKIVQQAFDIVMEDDMPEVRAQKPRLQDGHRQLIYVPETPWLKDFMQGISARVDEIKAHSGDKSYLEIDNYLKVASDARRAATDPALIDASLPFDSQSKIGIAAQNIYDDWVESTPDRGAQLVFLDLGTPKSVDDVNTAADKASSAEAKEAKPGAEEELAPADETSDAPEVETETTEEASQAISTYGRIKSELIRLGIPEREIAFIHEAKTPAAKQALMASVNAGTVRVLIGSSEKMGPGMNVQERLYALHHIDAPWRPRDLVQREGRILRQGNEAYGPKYDEAGQLADAGRGVKIKTYVWNGSFDAYIWNLIEKKWAGVKAIMKRDVTVREIDEADEDVMDAAAMKAAASGNPLAFELAERQNIIGQLQLRQGAYTDEVLAATHALHDLPDTIRRGKSKLAEVNADLEYVGQQSQKPLLVTADGRRLDKRADIGAVFEQWYKANRTKISEQTAKPLSMGMRYRGWELLVHRLGFGWFELQLGRKGGGTYATTGIMFDEAAPTGWSVRLDNVLSGIQSARDYTTARIAQYEADLVRYRASEASREAWPYQSLLDRMIGESKLITEALNRDRTELPDLIDWKHEMEDIANGGRRETPELESAAYTSEPAPTPEQVSEGSAPAIPGDKRIADMTADELTQVVKQAMAQPEAPAEAVSPGTPIEPPTEGIPTGTPIRKIVDRSRVQELMDSGMTREEAEMVAAGEVPPAEQQPAEAPEARKRRRKADARRTADGLVNDVAKVPAPEPRAEMNNSEANVSTRLEGDEVQVGRAGSVDGEPALIPEATITRDDLRSMKMAELENWLRQQGFSSGARLDAATAQLRKLQSRLAASAQDPYRARREKLAQLEARLKGAKERLAGNPEEIATVREAIEGQPELGAEREPLLDAVRAIEATPEPPQLPAEVLPADDLGRPLPTPELDLMQEYRNFRSQYDAALEAGDVATARAIRPVMVATQQELFAHRAIDQELWRRLTLLPDYAEEADWLRLVDDLARDADQVARTTTQEGIEATVQRERGATPKEELVWGEWQTTRRGAFSRAEAERRIADRWAQAQTELEQTYTRLLTRAGYTADTLSGANLEQKRRLLEELAAGKLKTTAKGAPAKIDGVPAEARRAAIAEAPRSVVALAKEAAAQGSPVHVDDSAEANRLRMIEEHVRQRYLGENAGEDLTPFDPDLELARLYGEAHDDLESLTRRLQQAGRQMIGERRTDLGARQRQLQTAKLTPVALRRQALREQNARLQAAWTSLNARASAVDRAMLRDMEYTDAEIDGMTRAEASWRVHDQVGPGSGAFGMAQPAAASSLATSGGALPPAAAAGGAGGAGGALPPTTTPAPAGGAGGAGGGPPKKPRRRRRPAATPLTPEQEYELLHGAMAQDAPELRERLQATYDKALSDFYDKLHAIDVLSQRTGSDAYAMARRVPGMTVAGQSDIERRVVPVLRTVGKDVAQLEEYLVAMRMKDLRILDAKAKLPGDVQDPDAALQGLRAAIGAERYAKIEAAAEQLWKLNDELVLKPALTEGRLNQEGYDAIRRDWPHYIPFQRQTDDWAGDFTFSGTSQPAHLYKKFSQALDREGSTKRLDEPLARWMGAIIEGRVANARNQAARATVEALEQYGALTGEKLVERLDHMPRGAKDVISYWNQATGQRVNVRVPAEYASAARGLEAETVNALSKIMMAMAMPLRMGATTLNPAFLVVNPVRDGISAWFMEGLVPLSNPWIQGMAAAFTHSSTWHEAAQAGVFMGGMSETARNRSNLQRALGATGPLGIPVNTLGDGLLFVPRLIMELNERMEQGTRTATWVKLTAEQVPEMEKVLRTRNVTVDFNMSGNVTKLINQMIPFTSAGVSGTGNTIRMMRNNPKKALLRAAPLVAASVLFWLWNQHFDTYEDIPDYEHALYWTLMLAEGEKEPDPSNPNAEPERFPIYIKIPKGPLGAALTAIPEALMQVAYKNNDLTIGETLLQGLGTMATAMMPIDPSIAALTPPLMGTAYDIATNRDTFRDMDIVPQYEESRPPEERYDEATSALAVALGQTFKVSPRLIDYAIKDSTGGAGSTSLWISDLVLGAMGYDPNAPGSVTERGLTTIEKVAKNPVLGRFVGVRNTADARAGYKNLDKAVRAAQRTLYDNEEFKRFGLGVTAPASSYTVNGVSVEVTYSQQIQMVEMQTPLVKAAMDDLTQRQFYQEATDAEKREMLTAVRSKIQNNVRGAVLSGDLAWTEDEMIDMVSAYEQYREYQALPTYVGLTDEEVVNMRLASARVTAIRKANPAISLEMARRSVAQENPEGVALSRRSGQYSNPERKTFWAAHPLLNIYFGSLSADDVDQFTTAAISA